MVGNFNSHRTGIKRSARMRTDSDRNLSAEADPNPARKTRERVLTIKNFSKKELTT